MQKTAEQTEAGLFFDAGAAVSFDTYFNCFSYKCYLKHTNVKKLIISLRAKGRARVDVFLRTLERTIDDKYYYTPLHGEKSFASPVAPDTLSECRLFARYTIDGDGYYEKNFSCDISRLADEKDGYLFFKITAEDDGFVLKGGGYYSEIAETNPVKIGMVICTYKREKYVFDNLERISGFVENSPCPFEVFVVDNGNTLKPRQFERFKSFARLIPNRNLGGSGGFTRGIYELSLRKNEGFTHFLLTDDDISFDISVLYKTVGLLLAAARPELLSVGAGMLRLDKTAIQHEMGAKWMGKTVRSVKSGFDVSDPYAVLKNEEESDAEYSAWWYMCMPLSTVERNGFPLPMFIKCDDVEYGLRCIKELALVNGIGVWHEPFDEKYSAELEYYIKRNELITAVLYDKNFLNIAFEKLVRSVARQLLFQRYYALYYIYRAFEDFMKGADYLNNVRADELHAELRKRNIKYKPLSELKAEGFAPDEIYLPQSKKMPVQALTLNGYLVPYAFYAKENKNGYRTVDMARPKPKQFFKVKRVLQYNFSTETGFVTEQKKSELFKAGFKIVAISVKLLFKYPFLKRDWKKGFNTLTSREYWQNTFEIN